MDRPHVRYVVLRDHREWDDVSWAGLEAETDGVLTLARLPEPANRATIVRSAPFATEPSGIAVAPNGDRYLADASSHSVVCILTDCGETLRHYTRSGSAPRGMLIGPRGLYVADDANACVELFDLVSLELRAFWTKPLKDPVALACDVAGRVYVLDRGAKRVFRFGASGGLDPAYDGALPPTSSPYSIALGDNAIVYVSDGASNRVYRCDADGHLLGFIDPSAGPAQPRALAARGARLYVADALGGAIWLYVDGQGWLGTLPGYQGAVSAMTIDDAGRLYVKPGLDGAYHVLEASGAYVSAGSLSAGPFDAGIESEWERVKVSADVPADCAVELRLWTADSDNPTPTETQWASNATVAASLDTLVPPLPGVVSGSAPGKRYLWLRVALHSADPHASPRVHQIQAATTGESYLDHLPAVYRREDAPQRFLERWLALFRGELGDWERALDDVPRRFDPRTAPEELLPTVAAWLAFELPRRKTVDEWRALLPTVARLYERRGTPFGIREICELYTGVRPRLFEAFHERHVWHLDGDSGLGCGTALAAAAPEGMVVPGFVHSDPAFAGLQGDYYAGTNFEQLKRTRIDQFVGFDWQDKSPFDDDASDAFPVDGFSVRWTGQIRPRYSETYIFSTTTDDGVRLWIDGRLIIDAWQDQAATEHAGRIALEGNRWYALTLEYYEKTGSASVALSWASRSQPREVVPQTCLYALVDEGARAGGGAFADSSDVMLVGQTVVGESGPLTADAYGEPLFAETAHLFTVLVPSARVPDDDARQELERLIEAEKPAHTDFHLCFVKPAFRVGQQARLGIDAVVAAPPPPGRLDAGVLGLSARLGMSADHASSLRVEENLELRPTTRLR